MANLRLIVDNAHDDAILSADQEAMPISNTQGSKGVLKEYPWRSTDTTVQTWSTVFPEKVIDGFGLFGANLTQAATLTLELKLATVLQDTQVIAANGTNDWVKWFSGVSADEVVVTLDDTTNPAGYLQFVMPFYGPKVEVAYNYDLGMKFRMPQDVEHIRTAGDSLRSGGTQLRHKKASLNFSYVLEADRIALIDALLLKGQAYPMFVSLLPEAGGRGIIYRLSGGP